MGCARSGVDRSPTATVEGLDERGGLDVAKHEEKADQDSQKADEKKGTENPGGDPDGPEGQHRK